MKVERNFFGAVMAGAILAAMPITLAPQTGTAGPGFELGFHKAAYAQQHGAKKRAGKGAGGSSHSSSHTDHGGDEGHDDAHSDDGDEHGEDHVGGAGKKGNQSIEGKVFVGNSTTGKGKRLGAASSGRGGGRGTLFGDMYALLRDDQGVPILTDAGFVQPVDADGNPIPLDDEGHPVDETLTLEVELGRLNVSRAPAHVLESRMEEAVRNLNTADELKLDPAGRLVFVVDGEEKTIDSPLENLGLYKQLISTGSIEGLTLDAATLGDLAHLTDGVLTAEDYKSAASFLAGAADKTQPISIDKMVYLNTIAGVDGAIPSPTGTGTFVDFTTFAYDRTAAYAGVTADVIVKQPDGTYQVETIDVFADVFESQGFAASGNADAFAQAADDARAIINYVHEYEVPAPATN